MDRRFSGGNAGRGTYARSTRGGSQGRDRSYTQSNAHSGHRSSGGGYDGGQNNHRGQSGTATFSQMLRGRMGIIFGLFCVAALVIAGRLVWLQIIDAENISNFGTSREVTVDMTARRGTIYDRNGVILATTVDAYNVFCHPHVVDSKDAGKLADKLAEVFGGEAADYKDKITQDTNFVYLYKGADEDQLKQITDLKIEGVDYEETSKRVYPCGATASQIIGVLNSDGDALTGIELYYDDILGGTDGQKVTEYSKEGVPVPGSTQVTAEVVNGQDIVLSIDVELQQRLEESLAVRVDEVGGDGGSAILMDSETGEIYACSSSPTFNITDLSEVKEGATNLSGISSAYEPGSVFKAVTMLGALEEGTVTADTQYDCPSVLEVDDYKISDSHDRPDATMTTTQIMADSSNVGMSLIAKDLGFKKLYNYIKQYEVCDATNVDYPGEASGSIADRDDWSSVQGYNISFGQGVVTSPIGITRFYAAVDNDGVAVTPHFLMDVPAESEDRTWDTSTITEDTDALNALEGMLEEVVDSGTATTAAIDGFAVAGKTGTAEIASDTGGYKKKIYNISFVGYLPDTSTNLVCFVGATEVPGMTKTTSVFKDIMTFAIDRYGITQD